jgi:hypothetical protein
MHLVHFIELKDWLIKQNISHSTNLTPPPFFIEVCVSKKDPKGQTRMIICLYFYLIENMNVWGLMRDIPDEGYSNNVSCAPNLISTFLLPCFPQFCAI